VRKFQVLYLDCNFKIFYTTNICYFQNEKKILEEYKRNKIHPKPAVTFEWSGGNYSIQNHNAIIMLVILSPFKTKLSREAKNNKSVFR
jgi:hypothetical protein